MKLPIKPSELIRLALSDLRKCEADPDYTTDMSSWHEPGRNTCYVCLAGAVMAKSLGADRYHDLEPMSFADVEYLLFALDHFRVGDIGSGLENLGFKDDEFPNRVIIPYRIDSEKFHKQMHVLADDLEKVCV